MKREAVFSPCGQFRYMLTRIWDASLPILSWGLCNPSVAGGEKDDPTARKVVGFSERLGCGGAVIWNPFAFVSTDPKGLKAAGWPIGPENDRYILEACRMGGVEVICGWGANLRGLERPARVLALLRDHGFRPMALKLTKDGIPMHPLYLPYDLKPAPMGSASGVGKQP